MSRAWTSPAQRRSDAAPLALVVAGWALAFAPLAHPLVAHGAPFLGHPDDRGWVQHADGRGPPAGPARPVGHTHAPGAPEHLQVPLLAVAPPAVFLTAMRPVETPRRAEQLPVPLPRRWREEQPQAP